VLLAFILKFFHLHSALTTLAIKKCSVKFFFLVIEGYKICSPVKNRYLQVKL